MATQEAVSFDSLLVALHADLDRLAEQHCQDLSAARGGETNGRSTSSRLVSGIQTQRIVARSGTLDEVDFQRKSSLKSTMSKKTSIGSIVTIEEGSPVDCGGEEDCGTAGIKRAVRKHQTVRRWASGNQWATTHATFLKRGNSKIWQEECPSGVLNPISKRLRCWEIFLMSLVFLDVMYLPFQIAYKNSVMDHADWMWLGLLTTCFSIDIVLNFFTAYKAKPDEHPELTPGTLVADTALIARKYLKGWFWMDLVNTIPWYWVAEAVSRITVLTGTEMEDIVDFMRTLRLLRLVRLAKLVVIWEHFEHKIRSFTRLQITVLLRISVIMLCVCHWNACFWWMIGKRDCALVHYLPASCRRAFEDMPHWTSVQRPSLSGPKWSWIDKNIIESYLFCFYWTLGVMRTMPTEVFPVNVCERIYVMFFMFIAFSLFGCTVAQITAMFNKFTERQRAFKEELLAVRRHLREIDAPADLQNDIYAYLKHLFENRQIFAKENAMLGHLPEHLSIELKHARVKPHLKAVSLFDTLTDESLNSICEITDIKHLTNGHILTHRDGIASGAWVVITGHVHMYEDSSEAALTIIDEDCLKFAHETLSPYTTVSITCSQVLWIEKDLFLSLLDAPDFSSQMQQSMVSSRQDNSVRESSEASDVPLMGARPLGPRRFSNKRDSSKRASL